MSDDPSSSVDLVLIDSIFGHVLKLSVPYLDIFVVRIKVPISEFWGDQMKGRTALRSVKY